MLEFGDFGAGEAQSVDQEGSTGDQEGAVSSYKTFTPTIYGV